ncbi:hypothetical protein TCAL_15168 [Tigriopus californicus]|uniref:Uncharacterized protein n=1 Tax=Tigriopus californicus TaxID=6832 RepID=A0A553NU24_TIGCA|nr:hypothetical protein TCAL_15168 [Tigriopus californicus]
MLNGVDLPLIFHSVINGLVEISLEFRTIPQNVGIIWDRLGWFSSPLRNSNKFRTFVVEESESNSSKICSMSLVSNLSIKCVKSHLYLTRWMVGGCIVWYLSVPQNR